MISNQTFILFLKESPNAEDPKNVALGQMVKWMNKADLQARGFWKKES